MSVIVAIKENGVVYMGADTQSTAGNAKQNFLNETAFKIVRLNNGMLIGFCGKVITRQAILAVKKTFVLNQEGGLDKKHIVREIVPKLVEIADLEGVDTINGSLLLAYKDKLYEITSDFDVISLNECGNLGGGRDYTNWYLFGIKDLPVRERILKALTANARRTKSVSGPYILIDTLNRKYEIADMGGNNY